MASVHSVTKHLAKAIKGAKADAERAKLYRKTSEAYSGDVVDLLKEFAGLVSEVTGLEVSVSVEKPCLEAAKRAVSERVEAPAAAERACTPKAKLTQASASDKQNAATPSLEQTVNELKQMVYSLSSQYSSLASLLSSNGSAVRAPAATEYANVPLNASSTQASSTADKRFEDNSCSGPEKVSGMTRIKDVNQKVPVIMHSYTERDLNTIYDVLIDMSCGDDANLSKSDSSLCDHLAEWVQYRYLHNRAYKASKTGSDLPAYSVKSIPSWLVAWCLLYASYVRDKSGRKDAALYALEDVLTDWQEKVNADSNNMYAVPPELQKSKLKGLQLSESDLDYAFGLWKSLCDSFNKLASKKDNPVQLYYDQFASKLKLAKLFDDEVIRKYVEV